MTINFNLAEGEQPLTLCPTALQEAPFGRTGLTGVEEVEGTGSCTRTDVAAILESYDGEISNVEDGIFAILRTGEELYQVELSPTDFEPGGPLKPGQTFEAQWVRLESGVELWRCLPDPPQLPSREQVREWREHYRARYAGTGL